MKLVQAEIYDYVDENVTQYHDVDKNLPREITYEGKKYVWLFNPGFWVEESERNKIVNSHNKFLPDFDENKRIWQIHDCLDEESVVCLIAQAFLDKGFWYQAERCPQGIKSFEKIKLIDWLSKGCYPTLYHQHFVQQNKRSIPDSSHYSLIQLTKASEQLIL
jgi:hypothetical protein